MRLRPPATLSPAARVVFLSIVAAEVADHFRVSDLPLLVSYCEASALAERVAVRAATRQRRGRLADPMGEG
jgi:hypothetical protein